MNREQRFELVSGELAKNPKTTLAKWALVPGYAIKASLSMPKDEPGENSRLVAITSSIILETVRDAAYIFYGYNLLKNLF